MLVFMAWFWGCWAVVAALIVGAVKASIFIRNKWLVRRTLEQIDEYLDRCYQ